MITLSTLSCQGQNNFEGNEPGECSDRADNDADGLFDCNDEGCLGAPDCQQGDTFLPGMLEDTPSCDAGDEAFVRKVVPQLWGRHPLSLVEVELLSQIIEQSSRQTLVQAMMRSHRFQARWHEVLKDFLQINRVGERTGMGCSSSMSESESHASISDDLAEFVRDAAPDGEPYPFSWSLTELILSSLALDDISPVFRAHLFTQLGSKVINLDNPGANVAWRGVYADLFESSYLNRRMGCLACHNSEYSVTDAADPELDRTWQVPGHVEKALYGDSGGRPFQDLAAYFRVEGVLDMRFVPEGVTPALFWDLGAEGFNPWGMSSNCGTFILPEDIQPDCPCAPASYLVDPTTECPCPSEAWEGHFIEDTPDRPSIWHLERWLRGGFDRLREGGYVVADDNSVDGEEAFAWMVAMSTAEKVWTEVTGRKLTTPHFFPRNPYQRDLLQYLTEVFVDSSFSLKTLVEAAVLHPYFNPGMPDQCDNLESPYYLAPVFNPWVVEHETPELRLNNPGDAVERLPPRALLGALSSAMDWPDINSQIETHEHNDEGTPIIGSGLTPALEFEIDIGIYLLDGETGFRSSNFAEALAWEEALGACVNPFPLDEEVVDDWIDLLVSETPADSTLEDLVLTLKDRLVGRPVFDHSDERALIEALAMEPLDATVDSLPAAQEPLRRVCSGFLSSPDFLIAGAPGDDLSGTPVPIAPTGSSTTEICAQLVDELFANGQASCTGTGAIQL